eukprot:scaffold5452_cov127-Isochrysis_galbana.AAC.1
MQRPWIAWPPAIQAEALRKGAQHEARLHGAARQHRSVAGGGRRVSRGALFVEGKDPSTNDGRFYLYYLLEM